MKAILAPVFSLLMALAVLAALGPAPASAPVVLSQKPPASLGDLLAQGPACFTWTEMAGDSPLPHEGGMVFYLHDRLVYGSAWFRQARYTRRWPLVAGVGTLTNDAIYIAFRNATNDPDHEFYHAACVFQFNMTTKEFECEFMQQAEPYSGRVPGWARGRYVPVPGPEYEPYVTAIVKKAQGKPLVAQMHPCPVLRHNEGKGEYSLYLGDQEFHFCCPSCKDVFMANPEVFMRREAPEEP